MRFDAPPVGEVIEPVVRADPTWHTRKARDRRAAPIGADHEPGTDLLGHTLRSLEPDARRASVIAQQSNDRCYSSQRSGWSHSDVVLQDLRSPVPLRSPLAKTVQVEFYCSEDRMSDLLQL